MSAEPTATSDLTRTLALAATLDGACLAAMEADALPGEVVAAVMLTLARMAAIGSSQTFAELCASFEPVYAFARDIAEDCRQKWELSDEGQRARLLAEMRDRMAHGAEATP